MSNDTFRRLGAAIFWCFVFVVVVPLIWGVLAWLLTRVGVRLGDYLFVPLFFYSWPATVVFGSDHFNLHACCLPADWTGFIQVEVFYSVCAVVLGVVIWTIRTPRLHKT